MADWSAFKGRKAFALAVLLIGGIFLPAVCAAGELGHWWLDPCDKLRKVRHEGSQEVNTQLNSVISHLKKDLQKLRGIFKTELPVSHPVPKHPWLNNAKFKSAMKKQKNKDNALAEFHKALQIYGGTIYILNETEIDCKASDTERAFQLLTSISYEMKRLTCEVANDLDEKNIKSPVLKLQDMNIKLEKKIDFSRASLEYHEILTKYRKFLIQSRRILFGRNAEKGKKKSKKKNNNNNKRKNKNRRQ